MTQGVFANIIRNGRPAEEVLVIGSLVPKIHHADRVPVYLIRADECGALIALNGGRLARLLAYPSDAAGPGERTGLYVWARHERLPFNAPVPIFTAHGAS